jgi:hypothetical protein
MSSPTFNYLFFSLAFLAATAMIVEGCLIIWLKKQLTPLPTRILYGLGALAIGKEKSSRQFLGRLSARDLRSYGLCVMFLGAAVLISSFIYLFTKIV